MSDCLFCRIANKELGTEVLMENDYFMAFSDINPKAPVHVLIIPKKHFQDITDIEGDIIAKLPDFIKELSEKLGVSERGFRIITNKGKDGGQIIFHTHFHLLAGKDLGDLIKE
ncbi:MAG: Hit-like protein involved in cell-cycle regulation [Fusobacteria bacterium]|nr:MAG: Hit-like protein involved in cell-cycle regulation [Fusobacteriota bacterium]KAF0229732.1 MAG: Hit-like protein involved in cell-cycle [Fusobacteriota bacterium]